MGSTISYSEERSKERRRTKESECIGVLTAKHTVPSREGQAVRSVEEGEEEEEKRGDEQELKPSQEYKSDNSHENVVAKCK